MKKPVYIRCPRCELNYIQKKDKYCSVCKAEMEAKKDYVDDLDLELCPICKVNYIGQNEIMCASCLKEHQNEDGELNEDWEDYLAGEEGEDMMMGDDDSGDMATVNDLTKSTLLDDDDDMGADIDFGDEDINFEDDDESLEELAEEEDDDDDDYDDDDDDDFDDDYDYDDDED